LTELPSGGGNFDQLFTEGLGAFDAELEIFIEHVVPAYQ
jgi:hypothetical protein